MKKLIPLVAAVAVAVSLTYARGEAATDTKMLGDVSVQTLRAISIDAEAVVVDPAVFTLGPATVRTNLAKSFVYTKMGSNGVFATYTNTIPQTVVTNANVIGPAVFYGKSGLRLAAPTTGYSCSLAAPGSSHTRVIPAHNQVYEEMNSAGVFVTKTNVVAASTVTAPAATIGQLLTIVASTNMTFTSGSTLIAPASTNYTMVAGSVLVVTPVSGSQWKAVTFVD